jgi:hypothetical protein
MEEEINLRLTSGFKLDHLLLHNPVKVPNWSKALLQSCNETAQEKKHPTTTNDKVNISSISEKEICRNFEPSTQMEIES